jgi:CRP-like cAMP-binding protein
MLALATPNRLLGVLNFEEIDTLAHLLTRVDLPLGTVLEEANQPVAHAYFMESGLASVMAGTPAIETGLVGFEGMTGLSILLGDGRSPNLTFIAATGSAMRVSSEALQHALSSSPTLRLTLLRYALAFHVQVSQTAVANGRGTVEARVARWLLMAHDRFQCDTFHLTHEFLAAVLCVRRAGVTVATHVLEGYGLIRASRRRITILDRHGLQLRCGRSYGTAEDEYERLMTWRGQAHAPPEAVAVSIHH